MSIYLKLFKSNLTIITLIFYVLGYSYLSVYYYQFEISIVNYINLLDILFTTINYLVILILTYLFIEFILYTIGILILNFTFNLCIRREILKRLGSDTRVQKYLKFINDKYYSNNIKGITLFLFILSAFLFLYFSDETLLIFSLFFPFFIIKFYQIIPKEKGERQVELSQFFFGCLILILIGCFSYWGYNDGILAKESRNGKQIEFKEQDILYSTRTDSLNFIGETNEYLFLYNYKKRETLIFNKAGTTNFKIKDTSRTKEEKKTLQLESKKKIDAFFDKLKKK